VVVVDSSVWIDFFNGSGGAARDALRQLLSKGDVEICVPDLVLYEVLRGFRQEQHLRDARRLMRSLTIADTAGEEVALAAAEHYRALRVGGITIRNSIDVLVAAFCIDKGHVLLHHDRDFDAFEVHRGLRVWLHRPAARA
jgi:predicted nucleic acid-binding protein